MTNEVGEHYCDLCGVNVGFSVEDGKPCSQSFTKPSGSMIEACLNCAEILKEFML